jgi:acylphosphatase
MTVAVRFLVSGRVQGVFYRASAAEQATGLGLNGWVRNLRDGKVELVAAGEAEQLERLAAWLWQGPREAEVAGVTLDPWSGELEQGFRILR